MIFNYSNKKLFTIFLIRLAPTVLFLFFALLLGEIFWVVTILFWMEAILEIIYRYVKGYAKITSDEIILLENLLFRRSVQIEDVYLTLSYDDEWAFRTKEKEVRINKKFIRKNQRAFFDEELKRIRLSVEKKKHLINR
ncbi:hypothetical protein [Moheibacter sp.]|uniref:hypothetical protein n=1 Tax=Moheibacter sp. TaxID=1965316 RepID=UPI003C73A603